MTRIDVHTHCDTTDRDQVRAFAGACEGTQTRVCLFSAGPRSDHPYCTNDQVMALARQYTGLFIPFAFVDLWDTVDAACIDAYKEAGFRGLKCVAPYYPYDHDTYMAVYERAEKLALPVVFHTGSYRPGPASAVHRRPLLRNMQPIALDRVARSFPRLKIAMAHMGTRIFRKDAAEMLKLHPNVYVDLAGCGSWMSITADELTELLANPIHKIDPSFEYFRKLVLGSDAYVSRPDLLGKAQWWYATTLERVGVPADVVEGIMGQTVLSWLGEC